MDQDTADTFYALCDSVDTSPLDAPIVIPASSVAAAVGENPYADMPSVLLTLLLRHVTLTPFFHGLSSGTVETLRGPRVAAALSRSDAARLAETIVDGFDDAVQNAAAGDATVGDDEVLRLVEAAQSAARAATGAAVRAHDAVSSARADKAAADTELAEARLNLQTSMGDDTALQNVAMAIARAARSEHALVTATAAARAADIDAASAAAIAAPGVVNDALITGIARQRGRDFEAVIIDEIASRVGAAVERRNETRFERHFGTYAICGYVDGIQQLPDGTVRVIEAKNRRRWRPSPPGYDIIQLRAYLELTEACEGSLVERMPIASQANGGDDVTVRETHVQRDGAVWARLHAKLEAVATRLKHVSAADVEALCDGFMMPDLVEKLQALDRGANL